MLGERERRPCTKVRQKPSKGSEARRSNPSERAHHHPLKLEARLADAELELLDDVGDLLEAVDVRVRHLDGVGDHQKRLPLEQNHLVRPAGKKKLRWVCICRPWYIMVNISRKASSETLQHRRTPQNSR